MKIINCIALSLRSRSHQVWFRCTKLLWSGTYGRQTTEGSDSTWYKCKTESIPLHFVGVKKNIVGTMQWKNKSETTNFIGFYLTWKSSSLEASKFVTMKAKILSFVIRYVVRIWGEKGFICLNVECIHSSSNISHYNRRPSRMKLKFIRLPSGPFVPIKRVSQPFVQCYTHGCLSLTHFIIEDNV